jgi:hypothetical protein
MTTIQANGVTLGVEHFGDARELDDPPAHLETSCTRGQVQ